MKWGQQTEDEMHIGYIEYIIPGAVPGESSATLLSAWSGDRPSAGRGAGEVRIGNRNINISELIDAIRKLDKNGDGKLFLAEVPVKHRPLFHLLDANDDEVLTVDEAQETIRQQRSR